MNDILCFAASLNGQTLISGSADRTIKLWSLGKKYSSACLKTLTGKVIHELRPHKFHMDHIATT